MLVRAAVIAIALAMAGCLTPDLASRGMMDRLKAVSGPVGADVIVMESVVVEVPPGDTYIDADLWSSTDEQAVALDRKAALEDNGYRIGVIGGLPPAKLQSLLYTDRTAPDPRRITTRSNNSKQLAIGPTRDEITCEAKLSGEVKSLNLTAAQFGICVTPTRTSDNRIKLALAPQVQHGGRSFFLQPADGDGWSITGQRPTEKFPNLNVEVTLSLHEFVVVGTRFEKTNTLGHATFVGPAGEKLVQRILVIRARPQGETPLPDWTVVGNSPRSTPLALQALRTIRGSRE